MNEPELTEDQKLYEELYGTQDEWHTPDVSALKPGATPEGIDDSDEALFHRLYGND